MGTLDLRAVFDGFRGKRVFVTGHTGFKGSWLTFLLNDLGAEVMGFALPPEGGRSHFEMLGLEKHIYHVAGDIRNAALLADKLREFAPEFVFHMAAQALVRRSYEDPIATFSTNVSGSVNLLDAVRHAPSVRSLVYITSDKCYENVEWVWGYRENDRLGGHDPYSASKAAAEIVFSAYANSYFGERTNLGAATSRAGNVIGGGDWAEDRIVPDCIRAIEGNLPVTLRNPSATRPWQHVLEPLSGYLLLAARLYAEPQRYAGAWNFGPSTMEVRTVLEVASLLTVKLGRGRVEVAAGQRAHHEAQLLQLNCDKAQQLLGWRPRWNVAKSLEATALWYKAMLEGEDVKTITRAQIREYFPELA
jgi:CDP-glucose 4,6-dehydratase